MTGIQDLEILSDGIWFEEATGTIIVGIDRVSLTLTLEEMWELCEAMEDAKRSLENHPRVVIGVYEEDGEIKKEFIQKPDESDIN